jgi:transcriptional regulator with XRE-family HTH domain
MRAVTDAAESALKPKKGQPPRQSNEYTHLSRTAQTVHTVRFDDRPIMLKKAFASTLRFMRRQSSVLQADFEGGISQSYVSRLERGQASITIEKLEEVAARLKVHPLTLVAATWGASEQVPPSQLLQRVQRELEAIDGLLQPIPIDEKPAMHPRILEAGKLRDEVQRLKALGHNKAEVSRALGIAKSTTARHW